MSSKRLLLIHLSHTNYFWECLFQEPENYRNLLLESHPEMQKWMPKELFRLKPIWPEAPILDYQWKNSVTAEFLAYNIETPTKILYGFISPEQVISELRKGVEENRPYTHVGFSIFVATYSKFIECAQAVKQFDKDIITIAGNAGALFPGTDQYVDYICRGDGVILLRELLDEDINKTYNLELVPQDLFFTFFDIKMKMNVVRLVTKLGCPNKCDFCITHHLYKGEFTRPFFTPKQVHDKLVEHYKKIKKKDLIIFFCEPQAIISKDWWYKLFELFENESGDYPITILTSLASIKDFDFDRIAKSSLRFSFINLGIESFSQDYRKNIKHGETKTIIRKLTDYGIGTYASFIIGYDHHTHESVWEEIRRLVDLDVAQIEIFNLKPLPETSLWETLKKENRLLNVPFDFYYIPGFQPFLHPHFKPGFEDMLPLMYDIYEYFEKERGPSVLSLIRLYNNTPHQSKKLQKSIKFLKIGASALFPSWKKFLNPTSQQIENYLTQLGEKPKIPYYLKVLMKSNKLKKLTNYFLR
ncbi:MAG: B12-binding domain-containing radical SAM protein [Promethearchaeota archaeon]